MTAENPPSPRRAARRGARFNEAAADDRGKRRGREGIDVPAPAASMRPRPMTAENAAGVNQAAGAIVRLQ